jgi:hypothetical protein
LKNYDPIRESKLSYFAANSCLGSVKDLQEKIGREIGYIEEELNPS